MMDTFVENSDTEDSALFCSTLLRKRKANANITGKTLKQVKLSSTKMKNKDISENCATKEKIIPDKTTPCKTDIKKLHDDDLKIPSLSKLNESASIYFEKSIKTNHISVPFMADDIARNSIKQKTNMGLQSSENSLNLKEKTKVHDQVFSSRTGVSKKRRNNGTLRRYILQDRTLEKRQEIITEKAAIILLSENKTESINKMLFKNPSHTKLLKYQNKFCPLWNLSENEGETQWYVEKIKVLIESDEKKESEENKMLAENICPQLNEEMTEDEKNEVLKLNLPKSSLHENWRQIINNEDFSDLFAISKDGHTIYLNSLVLKVRCSPILETDYKFIFGMFNVSTILIFLEYLCCGTLSNFKKIELENLKSLAEKFQYTELLEILISLEDNFKKIIESKVNNLNVFAFAEDNDLFDDDLPQQIPESTVGKDVINSSREDKLCCSGLKEQHKKEEIQEKGLSEYLTISPETEQIETNIYGSHESLSFIEKIRQNESILKVDDSSSKPIEDNFFIKDKIDSCIVLSSDTDTRESKSEGTEVEKVSQHERIPGNFDYDEPYFDPYENFNHFSHCNFSPVEACSQSLLNENNSPNNGIVNEDLRIIGTSVNVDETSTPLSGRQLYKGSAKRRSKSEDTEIKKIMENEETYKKSDCDEPYFDPYENFNHFSHCNFSPVEAFSQSLLNENNSPNNGIVNEDLRIISNSVNVVDKTSTPLSGSQLYKGSAKRRSKSEDTEIKKIMENEETYKKSDCDEPYFDPYENYNHFSDFNFSPVDHCGGSLINEKNSRDVGIVIEDDGLANVKETSTPLTIHRSSKLACSSTKKLRKNKSRISDLRTSKILQKSLGLKSGSRKSSRSIKRKSIAAKKELIGQLTNSILSEFSKSPSFGTSTPLRNKGFIEMTPKNLDIEIQEAVTPYPDYSKMGESLLKEHLNKYGLKKNLGKKKAKKILKHIYEELHPYLNLKNGKLVKKITIDSPKNSKKNKIKANLKILSKTIEIFENENKNPSKSDCSSNESINRSMNYDSNESDCESITQSKPNSSHDIPTVMKEFFNINPDFHQKILLYEPIWVRDLQTKLKETFKKRFKTNDLVNYLDQQCITFRIHTKEEKEKKKNRKNTRKEDNLV